MTEVASTPEPMARPPHEPETPNAARAARGRLAHYLRPQNVSALYVGVIVIIVFTILKPDLFPQWRTVQAVVNQNAIIGIIALSLIIPMACGVFDLSVGAMAGLANMMCAWLIVDGGVAPAPAVLLTLATGVALGCANAFVVVGLRTSSFIATLATGSLMTAGIALFSNYQDITGSQLSSGWFSNLSTAGVIGIAIPGLVLIATTVAMWFFQDYTASGRRVYATGFSEEAARLAGVRTKLLQSSGLIVSATVAAIGGILLTSQLQAGTANVGAPYLLGAFAAVFLGASQFKGGRFNAWGTLVAVFVLGLGKVGLTLAGAPSWAGDMFVGAALLGALLLSTHERRARVGGEI